MSISLANQDVAALFPSNDSLFGSKSAGKMYSFYLLDCTDAHALQKLKLLRDIVIEPSSSFSRMSIIETYSAVNNLWYVSKGQNPNLC